MNINSSLKKMDLNQLDVFLDKNMEFYFPVKGPSFYPLKAW